MVPGAGDADPGGRQAEHTAPPRGAENRRVRTRLSAPGTVGEARRPSGRGQGPQQVGIEDQLRGMQPATERGERPGDQAVLGAGGLPVGVGEALGRLGNGGRAV
jgi:hypothetical protein